MLRGQPDRQVELIRRILLGSVSDPFESAFVVRNGSEVCGFVALAPSIRQRRSVLTSAVTAEACRLLGLGNGIGFALATLRLMNLVCAPLPEAFAQLHSLVVSPGWRGCGVGAKLCRHVEDEASRDHSHLLLYVLAGNPAFSFYRRMGYQPVELPRQRRITGAIYRHPGCAMAKALARGERSLPLRCRDSPARLPKELALANLSSELQPWIRS